LEVKPAQPGQLDGAQRIITHAATLADLSERG
jgi:hypothetical protein